MQADAWPTVASLRQSIGLRCGPLNGNGRKKRSTKVSATFGGPKSERDLWPKTKPTGHRLEAEEDYDKADNGRYLHGVEHMPPFENEVGRSIRFLQRLPADQLENQIFLREGERREDYE